MYGTNLEVPKEVVGNFEVGSDGEDFVDKILNANDSELACERDLAGGGECESVSE